MLLMEKVISLSSSVGEDYKNEDLYIEIQEEIDKIQNIISTSKTDWEKVSRDSQQILEEKSKDLKLLTYWFYAQWKIGQGEKLLIALPTYINVIKLFNAQMYPKKSRSKIKLLEWLKNSLQVEFLADVKKFQKISIDEVKKLFESLDEALLLVAEAHTLPKFYPIARKLQEAIENQKKENPKVAIKKEEKPIEKNKVEKPFPTSTQQPLEDNNISKEREEKYLTHPLIEKVKKNIQLQIMEDKEEPSLIIILTLLQMMAFIELEYILNTKQKIAIEFFPTKESISRIQTHLKQKKNKELLDEIKLLLLDYPCWIEGYYFVILILEALQYKENYKQLKYNFLSFLENNHKLLKKYSPKNYDIVNSEMQKWMEKFSVDKGEIIYHQKYTEALILVKQKKSKEAIIFLDELYNRANTEEESFLWRLKQIFLAMETREIQIALALLYHLEDKIEKYHLYEWKPSLAIEVYGLFLNPMIARELTEEKKEKIYRKLCTLSTKSALFTSIH